MLNKILSSEFYSLIIIVRLHHNFNLWPSECTTRGAHSEQYNPREVRFPYTMIMLVNLLQCYNYPNSKNDIF